MAADALMVGILGVLAALVGAITGAIATHLLSRRIRSEERGELQARAEGRVSINAYALHRRIGEWLNAWPQEDGQKQLAWIREVTEPQVTESAEARVQSIVAESLNASSDVGRRAQEAAVLYFSALEILTAARNGAGVEVTAEDPYGGIMESRLREPWGRRVAQARNQLAACGTSLDELTHVQLRLLRESVVPPGEGSLITPPPHLP